MTVCRMTRFKVKVKVTRPLKFRKLHFSKSISSATYRGSTISKFDRAEFLKFVLVFVTRDLELRGVPAVSPSRKKFFRFQ